MENKGIEEYMSLFNQLEERAGYLPYLLPMVKMTLNWDRDGKILDLGVGTGKSVKLLKKLGFNNISGVDVLLGSLEQALEKDKSDQKLVMAEGMQLPFANKTFDYLSIQFMLQDFKEKDQLLKLFKESGRVLKDKGQILVVGPTPESYLVDTIEFECKPFLEKNSYSVSKGKGAPVEGKIFEDVYPFGKIDVGDNGVFEDYVWREEDLSEIFKEVGLKIEKKMKAELPENWKKLWWKSETEVPTAELYLLNKVLI